MAAGGAATAGPPHHAQERGLQSGRDAGIIANKGRAKKCEQSVGPLLGEKNMPLQSAISTGDRDAVSGCDNERKEVTENGQGGGSAKESVQNSSGRFDRHEHEADAGRLDSRIALLKGGDHPAPELEVGVLLLEGQDLLLGGSELMACLRDGIVTKCGESICRKHSKANSPFRKQTCSKSSRASCFS